MAEDEEEMNDAIAAIIQKRTESIQKGGAGSLRRKSSGNKARKDPINLNEDRGEGVHRKAEDGWISAESLSIEAS